MKRRDFLKTGALAASFASSLKLLPSIMAGESGPQQPGDNRSADYLRGAQEDKFLPNPPEFAETHRTADMRISPMPLAERIKRGLVPRRGFCSIAPGATFGEGLISGNGAMNIEMTCDPYSAL